MSVSICIYIYINMYAYLYIYCKYSPLAAGFLRMSDMCFSIQNWLSGFVPVT
jgi:hypothetical protein